MVPKSIDAGDVQAELRRRVRGQRRLERDHMASVVICTRGTTIDVHQASAVLRGHDQEVGTDRRRSRARACSAVLGDSVTTDHISPAGNIAKGSPAAATSRRTACEATDFNSYGSRRGNDDVMVRGTFANIRLQEPAGARRRKAASRCTFRRTARCPSSTRPRSTRARGSR